MPKISIIVPIYKIKQQYLEECIESLMKQTLSDIEIILIIDGSPDNSVEICNNYAVSDNRIMILQQSNQGVSVARNNGINHSKGEFIAFIDADDWVTEDMCEIAYNSAVKRDCDILIFGYIEAYPNYHRKVQSDLKSFDFSKEDFEILQLKAIGTSLKYKEINTAAPWCKLYKRSFIVKNSLNYVVGLNRMQDVIFSIHAIEKAGKISYVNYLGYYYRINSQSATYKYNPNIELTLHPLFNEIENFINMYSKSIEFKKGYYNFVLFIFIQCVNANFFHVQNEQNLVARIQNMKKLLNSDPYKEAIRKCNYANLRLKRKIICYLINRRQYLLLGIIFEIEHKIAKGKKDYD